MAELLCTACGKMHSELDMAIGYRRPAEVFAIPENERARRVKINDDLCSIDDVLFFIRAVLELPVKDGKEPFGWGVWVLVNEEDFHHYIALWDAQGVEAEPPFLASLANELPPYPGSAMLPVLVHLRSGGQRPLVEVESTDHPLGIDQRQGITLLEVHGFFKDHIK